MSAEFQGSLMYAARNGSVWGITRKQADNGGWYWHADRIDGIGHCISISCQRLLRFLDSKKAAEMNENAHEEWLEWLKTAPKDQLLEAESTRAALFESAFGNADRVKLVEERTAILKELDRRKENGE